MCSPALPTRLRTISRSRQTLLSTWSGTTPSYDTLSLMTMRPLGRRAFWQRCRNLIRWSSVRWPEGKGEEKNIRSLVVFWGTLPSLWDCGTVILREPVTETHQWPTGSRWHHSVHSLVQSPADHCRSSSPPSCSHLRGRFWLCPGTPVSRQPGPQCRTEAEAGACWSSRCPLHSPEHSPSQSSPHLPTLRDTILTQQCGSVVGSNPVSCVCHLARTDGDSTDGN